MNPLEAPKLSKYINDFSWILSTEQIEFLDKKFINHEITNTEQVVAVLIKNREWNELLDIWLKIFNENQIGQKNINNGLLLLISTEEAKIRIIVGKWLELKYTEMFCHAIIENQLRPLLIQGKYFELLDLWHQIVNQNFSLEEKEAESLASKYFFHFIGLCIFSFMIWVWLMISTGVHWFLLILFGLIVFIGWIGSINSLNKNTANKMSSIILISVVTILLVYFPTKKWYTDISCQLIHPTTTTCITYNQAIKSKNTSHKKKTKESNKNPSSSTSSFWGWWWSSNGGGYGD